MLFWFFCRGCNKNKIDFSVNSLIKEHSDNTAVTFVYLPLPPAIRIEEEELIYPQYLQMLSDITESLPPTILVHGMNTVTSTSL